MSYKGVDRNITIHWYKEHSGKYSIEVVPEHAEVCHGDTIVWIVQGTGVPDGISVANFQAEVPPPRLQLKRGDVSVLKPKGFPAKNLKNRGRRLSVAVGRGTPDGWYKYDVVYTKNGITRVLVDPELEIRGPKGG